MLTHFIYVSPVLVVVSLQWCHNEPDGVPNHRCLDCLLNRFLGRWIKKTSKLRVTGLCEGNPPMTQKISPFYDVIMFCVVCCSMDHRWLKICPRPRPAMIYGHLSILSWRQKKPPFSRRYFQMHFLEWFFFILIRIYILYIYMFITRSKLNWFHTLTLYGRFAHRCVIIPVM